MIIDIQKNYFDNISIEEAQLIYKMAIKQDILSNYNFPSHPSTDGIFRIWVKDSTKKSGRRQLSSSTLDGLKQKVYEYEDSFSREDKHSFQEIFDLVENRKLELTKNEMLPSKTNSIKREYTTFNRFFSDTQLKDKFIDDITSQEIERLTLSIMKNNSINRKAFNSYKTILKQVFERAYKEYWINDNAYLRADLNQFEGLIQENTPSNKRVHDDDTFNQILEAVRQYQIDNPSKMQSYALELIMLTGRREGDVTPLMLSDVSETSIMFNKEQILVKKFKDVPSHWVILQHTKNFTETEYPRYSEINNFLPKVYDAILRYYPTSKFLFPSNSTKSGIITNRQIYNLYYNICKKLGIKVSKDCIKGVHSFRRNACTDILNASNGNMALENYLLGHSAEVAKKHYYTKPDTNNMIAVLEQRQLNQG